MPDEPIMGRDEDPRRLTMPAPWTAGGQVVGRPPRHWKTPGLDRVSHIVNTAIIIDFLELPDGFAGGD